MNALSAFPFARALAEYWLKYVATYAAIFLILLLSTAALSREHPKVEGVEYQALAGLIVFVSFCVGWAAAVRKTRASWKFLLAGAPVAAIVPAAMAAWSAINIDQSFAVLIPAVWLGASAVLCIFLLWSYFVLGLKRW